MPGWECTVGDCGRTFGDVEGVLTHQVEDHARHECEVCDATVPAGFFAIQHVLGEHSRAQYVRAYDADSDDIRARERVVDEVTDRVDVDAIRARLTDGTGAAVDD